MAVTVLTCKSELESAQRLGYETVTRLRQDPGHTVIRWGNSRDVGRNALGSRLDFGSVVNPRKAIISNVNKLKALKKIAEVAQTPAIFTETANIEGNVLLRPIEHKCGEDFRVVRGPCKIDPGYYGTAWIATDTEYRVWFAWDRTLVARRVPLKRFPFDPNFPCRSNWGYAFSKDFELPKLREDTLKARKAIGLDCGAADVLFKDGVFYFLELNSAPTVDHITIQKFFKRALREKVGSNE